jgi:hypothetical protein
MQKIAMIAAGLVLWHNVALAQTNTFNAPVPETNAGTPDSATGVVGSPAHAQQEYTPATSSERFRHYLMSTFGPAAVARAIAAGGIAQGNNSPKEWGGGAQAFGERIGNSYAEHVIRKTLEFGGAAVLHEDNRYFHSTETGFLKRSKHAVSSVFVARNEAGGEHFAYSRFGGALGASFISRAWQPRSVDSSGDAAVNFGITILTDMGWNVVREYWPDVKGHFRRHQ